MEQHNRNSTCECVCVCVGVSIFCVSTCVCVDWCVELEESLKKEHLSRELVLHSGEGCVTQTLSCFLHVSCSQCAGV